MEDLLMELLAKLFSWVTAVANPEVTFAISRSREASERA
jgi:hypothetical protein